MTSIFVAKLDFGVTENELKALFEAYGGVKKVHIATDRETGKPRGFAFVEMYNDDEAQQAISALDGRNINGRDIAVKEAEDRRSGNSGPKKDFKPRSDFKPRQSSDDSGKNSGDKDFSAPVKMPDDNFDSTDSSKTDKRRKSNVPKTKEVDKTVDGGNKKKKLNPYKKSGKDQIFIDDDEDLEDFDPFGRDEDIEVDDDVLSNYLVNSDDDDDEDYDEDYEEDDFDEDDYDDENW
jgi:RNA recognition motif-containing protein